MLHPHVAQERQLATAQLHRLQPGDRQRLGPRERIARHVAIDHQLHLAGRVDDRFARVALQLDGGDAEFGVVRS